MYRMTTRMFIEFIESVAEIIIVVLKASFLKLNPSLIWSLVATTNEIEMGNRYQIAFEYHISS